MRFKLRVILGFGFLIFLILATFWLWQKSRTTSSFSSRAEKVEKISDPSLLPILKGIQEKKLAIIWVWSVKEKKIYPVVVKTGLSDGRYTEIKEVVLGKLEEGDLVVVGYQPTTKELRQAQGALTQAVRSLR